MYLCKVNFVSNLELPGKSGSIGAGDDVDELVDEEADDKQSSETF